MRHAYRHFSVTERSHRAAHSCDSHCIRSQLQRLCTCTHVSPLNTMPIARHGDYSQFSGVTQRGTSQGRRKRHRRNLPFRHIAPARYRFLTSGAHGGKTGILAANMSIRSVYKGSGARPLFLVSSLGVCVCTEGGCRRHGYSS
jgi:hypothetical protein